jgi:hypothetical protein
MIIGTRRFRDHVKLIAGRKLDITVGVVEELGEFSFDRLYDNELGGNSSEDFARFFLGIR